MTTALISVFTGSISSEPALLVNARDLHAFLGVGKVFAAWVASRIEEYGFIENQDFIVFSNSGKNTVGRRRRDYHLTLDTAKELAMVERNEKGRQIRRYFIECEKQLKQQSERPQQRSSCRYCATVTVFDAVTQSLLQMTVRDDCYKGLACHISAGLGWRTNSFTSLPRHLLIKIN
ncbi:hypothetical protein GWD52_20905 [Enterobacteriaceae bacterium 4M9]|nr:hypothetical protein [Enterobacteriaceae bacterium 4M9]